MEKLFKLRENGTTVGKEVAGGITTFFAMAYIIFVNPNFLSQAGWTLMQSCLQPALPLRSARR